MRKNLEKLFLEMIVQNVGTKETDCIEEQFINNITKTSLTFCKITNSEPDADTQAKLIPIMKEFTTKVNEILGGENNG